MHRCQHSFKKIPSNLWVVCVGSNSFQGISYPGKPQVLSSYSFKYMTLHSLPVWLMSWRVTFKTVWLMLSVLSFAQLNSKLQSFHPKNLHLLCLNILSMTTILCNTKDSQLSVLGPSLRWRVRLMVHSVI